MTENDTAQEWAAGLMDTSWINDAFDYTCDTMQRSILFMDTLRKRGNLYFEHIDKNKPPVLTYDYDLITDGRKLSRPVNYALVRIISDEENCVTDDEKRPVVIIDPRAGHGPGIGGSKRDSEIGVALKKGHPVYFVQFYPEPVPGQTIADVKEAEVEFVKKVATLHPEADEPAVIGNCQAGWAIALMSADRPDVTGPIVLNGSPMSYWAGKDGQNPMRYKGGILGGIWLTSLLSDLGNGKFDGANLVWGFEDLNPANTWWTKQYNLFAKIDTEEDRYLNFEKWWNGYFFMNTEEIHFIVENLFVGNRLEQGRVKLEDEKTIDLKNLEDPVVVFASSGDNITPPQQALNWIVKVYKTEEELKRCKQVIIYMVHESIGHLGIFVSGKVAQKEHKEIIGNIDLIELLSPGLYEMVIEDRETEVGVDDYKVSFVPRMFEDILAFDDGLEDEYAFEPVAAISEFNDKMYKTFVQPWVKLITTEQSAEMMRQIHPLRASRYLFSDKVNPLMLMFPALSEMAKKDRKKADSDNPFMHVEKSISKTVTTSLNLYKEARDNSLEFAFKAIYENPVMEALFPKSETGNLAGEAEKMQDAEDRAAADADEKNWIDSMKKGGFAEGLCRIMVAIAEADDVIDRSELLRYQTVAKSYPAFAKKRRSEFREMIKEQARILQTDKELALKTLADLLVTRKEREEAIQIARDMAFADGNYAPEEKVLIEKIEALLEL